MLLNSPSPSLIDSPTTPPPSATISIGRGGLGGAASAFAIYSKTAIARASSRWPPAPSWPATSTATAPTRPRNSAIDRHKDRAWSPRFPNRIQDRIDSASPTKDRQPARLRVVSPKLASFDAAGFWEKSDATACCFFICEIRDKAKIGFVRAKFRVPPRAPFSDSPGDSAARDLPTSDDQRGAVRYFRVWKILIRSEASRADCAECRRFGATLERLRDAE